MGISSMTIGSALLKARGGGVTSTAYITFRHKWITTFNRDRQLWHPDLRPRIGHALGWPAVIIIPRNTGRALSPMRLPLTICLVDQ